VCKPHAGDAARELRGDIEGGILPRQQAATCEGKTYSRIEMGAGQRPEHHDQSSQHSACRNRVAQECQRIVSVREPRGHDAGTDHGREQKCCAQPFRENTLGDWRHQVGPGACAFAACIRPISASLCCRLS
jgi:hypothetical protein